MKRYWYVVPVLVTFSTPNAYAILPTPTPLRVVVTNDDGYDAPGIDAVVEKLRTNPNLEITVSAPATDQSGTGDRTTTGPLTVTDATTLSGYPAKAVAGYPADSALFGILQAVPTPGPGLVVSGINCGPNVAADIVSISGTVGAALWAARRGIPAIAVSQGFGPALSCPTDFSAAANYIGTLVETFRTKWGVRNKMRQRKFPNHGLVLNINFPTCSSGSVRGVRLVPLDRMTDFSGYTLVSGTTWSPQLVTVNPFISSNCLSTLDPPATDVAALAIGFASMTPLGPDLGLLKPNPFKPLLKLFTP